MESKELETKLGAIAAEIETHIKKHEEEVKANGKASEETKASLETLGTHWNEAKARLLAIEQKMVAPSGGAEYAKTMGEMFVQSEQYKSLMNGAKHSGKVNIGSFNQKTTIVNATGQNQPLVPDQRLPGIIMPGLRRLTIRDLIPSVQTTSNLIQYVKETGFTNAAAMQTSEGAAKPESALTFALANAPVQTLAHWIPASKQILSDAPALQGYIETRLRYGLKLVEENQLLNGTGSGVNLSGLITNATAMDTAFSTVATDNFMDTILHAITQVQIAYYMPTGLIVSPRDWETIQLIKTTGTASSGEYIFADPHTVQAPRIWGLPVVVTQAMTQGQFLVGQFDQATIWDRWDATIEVSTDYSDYFVKNLVAILAEERLALTVYNALAFVYGGFPFGS